MNKNTMRTTLKLLPVLALAALLTACGGGSSAPWHHIPKTASMVVSVEAGQMLAKLEKDQLSVEQMLAAVNEATSSDYADILKNWNDIRQAGLDWKQPFFIATVADTTARGGGDAIMMLAALEDEAKFAAAVTKQTGATPATDGGISYVTYQGSLMAWKDKLMLISSAENLAGAKAIFALKKSESLAEIRHFKDAVSRKADVMLFTGGAGANSREAAMALAFVPKARELAQDIEAYSFINFEDGKATMTNETYVGDKLGKLLSKFAGPVVDASLVERFPGSDLQTVAAFSFNPELIPALTQELGLDALANAQLSQQDMQVNDFGKAFKGDFALMVGNLKVPEGETGKDGSIRFLDPTADMVMAIRIGDKAIFDKLIAKAGEMGLLKREGNRLLMAESDEDLKGLTMGIEGDLLVVSNRAELYTAYAAGAKKALPEPLKAALKDQSTVLYADLKGVMNRIPAEALGNDSTGQAMYQQAKNTFQSATMHMTNYKDGKLTGGGELVMAPGRNALSQLVDMMIVMAKAEKKSSQVVAIPATPDSAAVH